MTSNNMTPPKQSEMKSPKQQPKQWGKMRKRMFDKK